MRRATDMCPSPARLDQLLIGPGAEDAAVQRHLEHCDRCRTVIGTLAGDASTWSEARQYLSAPPDPAASRIAQSICGLSARDVASGLDDPLRAFELEQLQQLLESASHPELIGCIGRYELEQLVGRGGMGLVFRARDRELARVVAIKTLAIHLLPYGAARERFIREARATATLVHPHIVPIYDVITQGAVPAIVMQYIAGPTLDRWLRERGPMPWPETLRVGTQLAEALMTAHAQGLVHRDIKPGNVLLEADGSRALLTDFGLARALDDATLTRSGALAGTPDYMSPEQARGLAVDRRSDLFSLGAVLYTMLTGHAPFRAADPMAVMHRICHHAPTPVHRMCPDVPLEVSRWIDRLMAKEPRRRPANAEAVQGQLLDFARSQRRLSRRTRRAVRRCAIGIGAVALAMAAVGAGAWWTGDNAAEPTTARGEIANEKTSDGGQVAPGVAPADSRDSIPDEKDHEPQRAAVDTPSSLARGEERSDSPIGSVTASTAWDAEFERLDERARRLHEELVGARSAAAEEQTAAESPLDRDLSELRRRATELRDELRRRP